MSIRAVFYDASGFPLTKGKEWFYAIPQKIAKDATRADQLMADARVALKRRAQFDFDERPKRIPLNAVYALVDDHADCSVILTLDPPT